MKTKYKISIGYNYWDDPQGLLKMLEYPEFYETIHTLYLIDGRYAGRDDIEEHNPDLAQNISKSFDKIHYVKMYNVKQIEKRNKYLELAERDNMDFLIVLDSDEYIEFTPELDQSLDTAMTMKARCFPCAESWINVPYFSPRPRLLKKPFDCRYKENPNGMISHGGIWDKNGKDILPEMYEWMSVYGERFSVPGIKLFQDKTYRSKKRVDADYLYFENNPLR